jgi:hypothetical protein
LGEEILFCNDIDAASLALLMAEFPNHMLYLSLLPGKCLLAGFHSLFNGGGRMGKEIGRDLLKEVNEEIRYQGQLDNCHKQSVSSETLQSNEVQMDDLIILAREKRERLDGTWDWGSETREQVMKMAEWFRTGMLCRWKQNVLRSFLQSLHQKIPPLGFPQLGMVRFERPKPNVIFEAMALGTDPWPSSPLLPTHVWSAEGLGGKTIYCHWWLRRWSKAGQELMLWQDVVARLSRASWWAWDNGSCSIHWRWPLEYQEII